MKRNLDTLFIPIVYHGGSIRCVFSAGLLTQGQAVCGGGRFWTQMACLKGLGTMYENPNTLKNMGTSCLRILMINVIFYRGSNKR